MKILVPGDLQMVNLVGTRDELLKLVEQGFNTPILVRGNEITVSGEPREVGLVSYLFEELMELVAHGYLLTPDSVTRSIDMVKTGAFRPSEVFSDALTVSRTKSIRPKTGGQKRYVDAMRTHTIVFAIGPAGTGKTYLAVASAVQALARKEQEFRDLILKAYRAEPLADAGFFHGKSGGRLVVVGPINLPVGRLFVEEVVTECRKRGATRVDVLAFEFEMGLFPASLDEAKQKGIDLAPKTIPPEVFDKRAVERGQVRFHDVAYNRSHPALWAGRAAARFARSVPSPPLGAGERAGRGGVP